MRIPAILRRPGSPATSVGWSHAPASPARSHVNIDNTTWAALALILTILGAALHLGRLAPPRSRRRSPRARLDAAAGRGVADRHPQARQRASSRTSSTGPRGWCSPPSVWLGIIVAGVAAVLWVAVRADARPRDRRTRQGRGSGAARSRPRRCRPAGTPRQPPQKAKRERRRHRGHGRHRGDPEAARDLVVRRSRSSDAARHQLARRLNPAVAGARRPRDARWSSSTSTRSTPTPPTSSAARAASPSGSRRSRCGSRR